MGAEAQRRWREKNPEYMAEWRAKNKERIAAYRTEYRARNKEREIATAAEYRARNPERRSVDRARYRAAAVGASVNDLTLEEWLSVLEEYERRCSYCGTGDSIEMDHVVPLARGGANTRANVVPACAKCNGSKWAKTPEEWRGRTEE